MEALSISMLGALRVTADGVPVTHWSSDKARALLAYLAVQPDRPHRREVLAGLFWPEYPEASARRSLSQTLFGLRSDLGGRGDASRIQGDAKAILFSSAGCTVDALELESLTRACRSHPHADPSSCAECLERQARAAALYAGEFLEGFSLRDAPEFEEWLLLQREECRREAISALDVLSSHGELHGDASGALRYAWRWLELEPLDERAHRQVMRLLVAEGQSSQALAHYENCRRLLRLEVGAEPDARTTALYERILNGEFTPRAARSDDQSVRPPSFMSQDDGRPAPLFVAREEELARLQTHLDRMLAGQAQFAFVTGEAGCGKTALVHEFARRAGQAHLDLVVAVGRCNAFTGIGDPYLVFREILSQLGGDVEDGWRAGAIRSEGALRLWRFLPQTCVALAEAGPDLVGALVDGESLLGRAETAAAPDAAWPGRLRDLLSTRGERPAPGLDQPALFQQFTAVLRRLALAHPLLLVLEDLHWADAASLSLLFHLGAHLAADRILILGAYRPASPARVAGTEQGLETIVHELQRAYGEIIVNLDRADGQRFVSALIDAEPNSLDDAFREALYRQAGGNALFTSELLQALRERGDLVPDAAGRWRAGGALRWDRLPARVESVIAERIGGLPLALREALRVGSVEGETFTAEVIAPVLGVDPLALVRGLGDAAGSRHNLIVAAGLGRAQSGPVSSYRFRHILIQHSLYHDLDPAERVYLHAAVASALLALYGGDDDALAVERRHEHAVAGELARHYEEAGDIKRAVAWLRRAGDRAEHLGALAECALHHSRGLALTDRLPAGQERDAARLPLLLGLAVALLQRFGVTAPELLPILEEALSIGEGMGHAVACVRALDKLRGIYSEKADYGRAQECAERMLDWAQRTEDDGLIAWARCDIADVFMYRGDSTAALPLLGPALKQWDAGDRSVLNGTLVYIPGNTVRLLTRAALILVPLGYGDQALARVREGLDAAREVGLGWGLYFGSSIAMLVNLQLRDYGQALAWARECGERAARGGSASYNPWTLACEGVALAHMAEGDKGIALVREALVTTEKMGLSNLVPGLLELLADCGLAGGQAQEALAAAERGIALCVELGPAYSLASLHLLRGQALLLVDPPDPARAEEALQKAIAVAQRQEARLFELRAAVTLGRLWLSQDRARDALALVQPVYDWFTEGFDLPDLVEAREFLEHVST